MSPPAHIRPADVRLLARLRRQATRPRWPGALLTLAGWAGLLAIAWRSEPSGGADAADFLLKAQFAGLGLLPLAQDDLRKRRVRRGLARLWTSMVGEPRPELAWREHSLLVTGFFLLLVTTPLLLGPLIALDEADVSAVLVEILACEAAIVLGWTLQPLSLDLKVSLREFERALDQRLESRASGV